MNTSQEGRSRRRFLAAAVNTIHIIIGGMLAVVVGGALVGPSFLRRRERWLKAGSLDALSEGEPTPVTLRVARQDGYTQTVERQVVFLPAPDEEGKFIARTVQVGPAHGELATMRSGVEPGETVVTEGSFFLRAEMLRNAPASS